MRCGTMKPTEGKWSRIDWTDAVFENECLNASDRLVATVLARFADTDGQCFPGTRRLSSETKLARNTVKKSIERLQKAGLLTRELVQIDEVRSRYDYHLTRVKSLPDPGQIVTRVKSNPGSNETPDPGQMAASNTPIELTHKKSLTREDIPDEVVEMLRTVDDLTSGQRQLTPEQGAQLLELGDMMEVAEVFASMATRYGNAAFFKLKRYTASQIEQLKPQKPRNALRRDGDTLGQEIIEEMLANATSSDDEASK